MGEIERLTVTLTAEMAALIKGAVEVGDYASSSEVVRDALRDWKSKRAHRQQEFQVMQAEIGRGLKDLAEGRVTPFDAKRIRARGRKLSNARLTSV